MELIVDPAPLDAGGPGVVLREGGGDKGGDDPASALAGVGEDVAREVDAAALPGGVRHLGGGVCCDDANNASVDEMGFIQAAHLVATVADRFSA